MLQAADARSSARSGGAAAGRRPVRSAPLPQRAARRPRTAAAASAGGAEPSVTLKFVDAAAPGPIEVSAPSGEQLRATMLENKVDLYTTWGKIWSCGGVGQCGTCIVKIEEGAELLSERTATEQRKLKGKPNSWRLACQTIVGDGENSGSVVVATKPQQ